MKVYSQAQVSIFSAAWIVCSRGFEGKEAPDGTDPPSCLNMIAPYFTTAQYSAAIAFEVGAAFLASGTVGFGIVRRVQ